MTRCDWSGFFYRYYTYYYYLEKKNMLEKLVLFFHNIYPTPYRCGAMINMRAWSTGWWPIVRRKGFRFHSSYFRRTMWMWSHWRSWPMRKTPLNLKSTIGGSSWQLETGVISRSKLLKTSKFIISEFPNNNNVVRTWCWTLNK